MRKLDNPDEAKPEENAESTIDIDKYIVEENAEMQRDEDFDEEVTCKTPLKYCM